MKDALLILSGGMDSVTMLHEFAGQIALAVTFDYGSLQNHREIPCAAMHCRQLGVPHIVVPLAFMRDHFKSALLDSADAVPDGRYDDESMRATVVPFRNGVMLAIAAGIAESNDLKRVMIANHAGDHAIYPDCRPAFIDAMSAAISAGTYAGITVCAPYTDIDKTEIARRGKALGIDYATTYSCYKGGERHCGTCGTCTERREALAAAGIDDPTPYLTDD